MLEHSNTDREKTISATEMQRQTAEKISEDVKETLAKQRSQTNELRRRLDEAEHELSKYKDLASRYSEDRTRMKKALKEKVDIIKVQEDSLTKHSQENSTLSEEAKKIESELKQARDDIEGLEIEVKTLRLRSEEDQTKLANNQSVIAWLNKQAQNPTPGRPAARSLASLPPAAVSSALPTPSQSRPQPQTSGGESSSGHLTSNLSRYLPNASVQQQFITPGGESGGGYLSSNLSRYLPNASVHQQQQQQRQQQFITPDLQNSRQGSSNASRKLHPDPTPFVP